jgi:hypothetical protein
MALSDYYTILIVLGVLLLFLLVIFGAFFLGKRKYNQENGIVKEKKVREKTDRETKAKPKKSRSSLKLSEKDAAAAAVFNKDSNDGSNQEIEEDDDYQEAVNAFNADYAKNKKESAASGSKQSVVQDPVIVIDEEEVEEAFVEWKPVMGERKIVKKEPPVAAPAADEWNDEDLELFEARAYSFDEETQAGYVKKERPAPREAPRAETREYEDKPVAPFRGHREQIHDPADDEGVQVFETFEREKPEPQSEPQSESKSIPSEPPKSNSKYAYFDSVMEKDKAENAPREWQPPEKRKSKPSERAGMQYIELDLDDKK